MQAHNTVLITPLDFFVLARDPEPSRDLHLETTDSDTTDDSNTTDDSDTTDDSNKKTDDRFAYFTDGCAASASVCSERAIKKNVVMQRQETLCALVRPNDSLRGNQQRNLANNAP